MSYVCKLANSSSSERNRGRRATSDLTVHTSNGTIYASVLHNASMKTQMSTHLFLGTMTTSRAIVTCRLARQ